MLERSRIKEIDDRIKGIYRQEWLKKDEYKRKAISSKNRNILLICIK